MSGKHVGSGFWLPLLALGCGAGWHRAAQLPTPLPPRQQVQVWQHGTALRWHAVRITADTVSGIAFFRPITCDSCRVAVPRGDVDSIRLGNPVAGFWKGVGLAWASVLAVGVVYCWKGCGLD